MRKLVFILLIIEPKEDVKSSAALEDTNALKLLMPIVDKTIKIGNCCMKNFINV
tara:strand:+ start:928 stop:1089 length:162 start_codon:yes stop_codon:yes gene_type:complete